MAKTPNAETRVGRGKVAMAHHGRDSIGMKKAQNTDSNN